MLIISDYNKGVINSNIFKKIANIFLKQDKLVITNPKKNKISFYNGSNIIREVKLEIGGQTIDTHSKNWMMDWRELSIPGDKHVCLKRMMGDNSNRGYYIHENREIALPSKEVEVLLTQSHGHSPKKKKK